MPEIDALLAAVGPREIDPATGLWRLPQGYFFKIIPFNLDTSEYSLNVELRMVKAIGKRWGQTRWGSVELGSSLATSDQRSILAAAGYAIDRARKAMNKHLTIHDRDKYLGDYPPKTLPKGDQ